MSRPPGSPTGVPRTPATAPRRGPGKAPLDPVGDNGAGPGRGEIDPEVRVRVRMALAADWPRERRPRDCGLDHAVVALLSGYRMLDTESRFVRGLRSSIAENGCIGMLATHLIRTLPVDTGRNWFLSHVRPCRLLNGDGLDSNREQDAPAGLPVEERQLRGQPGVLPIR